MGDPPKNVERPAARARVETFEKDCAAERMEAHLKQGSEVQPEIGSQTGEQLSED